MNASAFFQDIALIMAVAGLVAALFSRLGWPKVLGYIGAGALLGGHATGGSLLVDQGSISTLAQLGVVFLMFSMGLSFSAKDMRRVRSVAVTSAVLDTIVMTWLGYTVGTRVFGWSSVQSVFLGVAICDSATTLLAKVLDETGWGGRPFAKYVLGTSLCEDIVCVGLIAVATGLANGGGMSPGAFAASLGGLAMFFLVVLVVGLVHVPRLLKSVGARKDDEALALTLLGVCFFVSFLAYRFDFSLALGAFLVGILGASSDVRERLAALVEPLKAMFSALFFVSIGLMVDPVALWENAGAIALVSAVVVVGKFANNALASLLAGLDVATAVQNALSLAQIGEFALMVAILYVPLGGATARTMFAVAVGASLVTTLLNPWAVRVSARAGALAERAVPARFHAVLAAYRAWLAKIGAAEGSPAFRRLKAEAIRLGVIAVLMFAVAWLFMRYLPGFRYARLPARFEEFKAVVFFLLGNILFLPLLPPLVGSSRALADAVAEMLCGAGASRWQVSVAEIARVVVTCAVVAVFFVEWAMLTLSFVQKGPMLWASVGVIAVALVLGWRRLVKVATRASRRLNEALTAEERRESLARTMAVEMPVGVAVEIPMTSPAIGGTVVTLNIRAKTGASIVSVARGDVVERNIGPGWEFRAGDRLVALGDHAQIAALKDLLGVTA
ncbi:MAG: cation:proton antiporter [Kiritimatiellae bacterium]|nr:cation:proton antiporter [Kiritimatiellia bacterium]